MINSAEEFKCYIQSKNEVERAKAEDAASDEVWFEILLKYPELARQVVANNTISVEVLERLSLTDDAVVRWDVAMKRRINRATFERLACDGDIKVRHRIACNPKVPKAILAKLVADEDEMVSAAAKKRLND
ncbi:hypothetical protein HKK52_12825 [Pseudomonas sp. ADAK2]|uniref:hypothetical protein n=1 Tax=unclassified Pseudomonas TaxID=196821 RepID=UPI001463EB97|nr:MULTISPECIES: hypothetical protein [unclassified Pseudomonas]QJI41762.1 hypothetical protein HKK53_12825 [Pseudomonas sp. ADAK7]QJI48066.1 hypothetical protein HKK52_12825 [Pseudomonas sp. ADAK2]